MKNYKVRLKKIFDLLYGKLIGAYKIVKYKKANNIFNLGAEQNLYNEDNNLTYQKGLIEVSVFKDVFLWPEFSVAVSDNEIISNTFVNKTLIDRHVKYQYLKKYPTSTIDTEYVTSIDKCFSATNYFHILIDTIPRLWALRYSYFKDKNITLLLPHSRNEDLMTIIKAVAPKNVIIKTASKRKRYSCKNYIHLPYLSQPRVNIKDMRPSAGYIPNEYLSFLRDSVNELFDISDNIVANKNIFISREDAKIRRIINESELLDALAPFNFEKFTLSGKSMQEQIEIFKSAKCIICMHGAALTNLLWVKPGQCTIIEIFPATSNSQEYYSKHANTLKLNYKKIEMNYSEINSDIVVDIDLILKSI